jgi:serine/threonine-protein kinase
MADDPRIQRLIDELLESQATPEEVCATCPELLPVVRNRWRQVRLLRADLDDLFPPNDVPSTQQDALVTSPETTPRQPAETALPGIPGYEVEGVLGRGGMGVVFKARHLKLNRPVAIKMLLAGAYAGPEELARFRREAEAVAALRHPNIVQVHDAGEVAGHPYFTMECVEGGTLSHSLVGRPKPPRRAAELLITLASAVQFAHQSGFIHRDLKPANVLLTADGVPKITDFGLVRPIASGSQVTRSGDFLGTPCYMAPEQARGHASAVGPAVDIYALGAVLYEMLTGRPPFDEATPVETIYKVITEVPAPPSRWNVKVPRDLDTICLKCLQKSPARRYASAQDLANDLHRFLDGKPVLARPVGPLERAVKWGRRRPAAALLVAALLVMLGAAVGSGVWLRRQEAESQAAKELREGQARQAVETALRRADDLGREERWQEALLVLTDALPNVAEANAPPLRQRYTQVQSDFQIAAKLEGVRESSPLQPDGAIDYRQRAAEFLGAFEHAELRLDDDEEAVADYIRASAIRAQLVAAIEDRAFVALMLNDGSLVERLLRIARSADPEPVWRDRFRNPAAWKDRQQLLRLAAGAFNSSPPPSEHQLALLALLLRNVGDRNGSSRLLGQACGQQPKNFWVHREMGFALLLEGRWVNAAAFFRTALTLRPDNAGVQEGLGMVLSRNGQTEEGLAAYRRAVELSPANASFHTNLVEAFANAGYWKDAKAACRRALEIDPTNYRALFRLAEVLYGQNRLEDATDLCRTATEIAPDFEEAQFTLGEIYAQTAQHEDAVKAFGKVTELRAANPPAGLLKAAKFPADILHAQELAAVGRRTEAIAVLETAAAREPKDFRFPLEAGKLYRSQGKLDDAANAFTKAADILSGRSWAWEELAAVRLDQGRFADARAATEHLVALPAGPAEQRAWRRQLDLCDSLLAIDDLPAVLAGKERPQKASTQRALAEWCLKHKRLTATAAGFYEAAFSAQGALADDLATADRFDAACAAALAGCGVGEDVAALSGDKRATLRKQALDWLTADYNAWAERHRLAKPGQRTVVVTAVRSWQRNDDLAGVCGEQALARLSADERRAWQTLWAKVATLAASDPAAKIDQARTHVARREWEMAVKCYAEGMELEPTDDGAIWFEYAAAQLLAGDRPGYRRACAHMLARCQTIPQMRPYLAARACTLAPDSTDDPSQPVRLSAKELEFNNERNAVPYWALTEQAALSFRTGRTGDAVPLLESSLVVDGRPGRAVLNWLWLALVHQKLGNPSEARRWLDRAASWLDQQGSRMPRESSAMGSHLHNWLEAHMLRREAESLLSPP